MAERSLPGSGGYLDDMGIARSSGPIEPLSRPAGIDNYAGQWVAVKDGRVVAAAPRARDLVILVREMGEEGADATVELVALPSDGFMVGVG